MHSVGGMDCQHCGKKVSFIRVLTGSQYCCEDHRWRHLDEMNRVGLSLLMRREGTSEQRELSAELQHTATLLSSGQAPSVGAGSRDSTESPCFRIGARVIQPPLIA